jgi:hypothetical protein
LLTRKDKICANEDFFCASHAIVVTRARIRPACADWDFDGSIFTLCSFSHVESLEFVTSIVTANFFHWRWGPTPSAYLR